CSYSVLRHTALFVHGLVALRALHSFPPRRSSDLHSFSGSLSALIATQSTRCTLGPLTTHPELRCPLGWCTFTHCPTRNTRPSGAVDRKSTRLNSSHVKISYAVFCLKKKKQKQTRHINKDKTQRTEVKVHVCR